MRARFYDFWARVARGARRRGGYTVVEVMMALSVLSIGATGVVAMQKVTLIGNTRARDLATATAIASSWIERLRYDGLRWNYDSATGTSTLGSTTYLSQPQNTWFSPASGGAAFGPLTEIQPSFDVKGMDTLSATETGFCVNVRLTTLLNNPSTPTAIPSAMRAEVRVYWLKVNNSTVDPALTGTLNGVALCNNTAANIASLDSATDGTTRYHFVYAASAILRNDI